MSLPPKVTDEHQEFGVFFDPFPESDTVPARLLTIDYEEAHTFRDPKTGETSVSPSVEYVWGANIDGKNHFVRSYPNKWSPFERSNAAKIQKAITGSYNGTLDPEATVGGGVLLTVENADKVSKKGKAYVRTNIRGITALPKAMKGSLPERDTFMADLEAALTPKAEAVEDSGAPF